MRNLINILVILMLCIQPATLAFAETANDSEQPPAERHCPDCKDCCDDGETGCDEACPMTDCAGGPASISVDPRVAKLFGASAEIDDPLTCLSPGFPPLLLRPPIIV